MFYFGLFSFYAFQLCQLLLVVLGDNFRASITVMFITNELIRSTISNTPSIVRSSMLDIETFSRDAHNEIINTIHEGMSTATERIKYDLESKC